MMWCVCGFYDFIGHSFSFHTGSEFYSEVVILYSELTSKFCNVYYSSCQDKIVNTWYMILVKKPPLPWRNEVTLDPTLFFNKFWLSKHRQDTAVVWR